MVGQTVQKSANLNRAKKKKIFIINMDINKRLKINDQNSQNNRKRKAKFDNTQNYFGKFIKI